MKPDFIGTMLTFLGLYWVFYTLMNINISKLGYISFGYKKVIDLIEKWPITILTIFIISYLFWAGTVIFTNPYNWMYNIGDATHTVQRLHNLSSGIGPELSSIYKSVLLLNSNPYFYASIFSVRLEWLPMLLLTPLYAIYPYPPMHVFAVVIVVGVFGSMGVYLAIRSIGGSKSLSLFGAIAYCLIPQVEHGIFFKGYFGQVGFAIMPYVFFGLFARRWGWFYFVSFLFALIGIPHSYTVIGIGLAAMLFFKARMQGLIACLIGFVVLQLDGAVLEQSLCGLSLNEAPLASLFNYHVLNVNIASMIKTFKFQLSYLFVLLMTLSFLPLFAIRVRGKWNWPVIGMFFVVGISFVMGLFRSYGWGFQRNSNLVVPLYLSAFMACVEIKKSKIGQTESFSSGQKKLKLVYLLLFSSIISMTLWTTWSYPWGGLNYYKGTTMFTLLKKDVNYDYNSHVLSKIDEHVPKDASLAFAIQQDLEAFMTNRQNAWRIGLNPDGVEYYVIETTCRNRTKLWKKQFEKLKADNNVKLLYQYRMLYIFQNLNPKPIPRLESVLGWDVLKFWRKCEG